MGEERGEEMYRMLDESSKPNCSVDAYEGRASLVKNMRSMMDGDDADSRRFVDTLDKLSKESLKSKWRGFTPAQATKEIICRGFGMSVKDMTDGHWTLVTSWSLEMAYCWQSKKQKTGEWQSEYVGVAGQGDKNVSNFYRRTYAHISNAFNPGRNNYEFFSHLSTRIRKIGIDRWRVLILPSSKQFPRSESQWIRALNTARTIEHRIGSNADGGEVRLLPIIDENEKGKKVEVRWFLGGKYAQFALNCISDEMKEGMLREKRYMDSISDAISLFSPPRTAEFRPPSKRVVKTEPDEMETIEKIGKKSSPKKTVAKKEIESEELATRPKTRKNVVKKTDDKPIAKPTKAKDSPVVEEEEEKAVKNGEIKKTADSKEVSDDSPQPTKRKSTGKKVVEAEGDESTPTTKRKSIAKKEIESEELKTQPKTRKNVVKKTGDKPIAKQTKMKDFFVVEEEEETKANGETKKTADSEEVFDDSPQPTKRKSAGKKVLEAESNESTSTTKRKSTAKKEIEPEELTKEPKTRKNVVKKTAKPTKAKDSPVVEEEEEKAVKNGETKKTPDSPQPTKRKRTGKKVVEVLSDESPSTTKRKTIAKNMDDKECVELVVIEESNGAESVMGKSAVKNTAQTKSDSTPTTKKNSTAAIVNGQEVRPTKKKSESSEVGECVAEDDDDESEKVAKKKTSAKKTAVKEVVCDKEAKQGKRAPKKVVDDDPQPKKRKSAGKKAAETTIEDSTPTFGDKKADAEVFILAPVKRNSTASENGEDIAKSPKKAAPKKK